MRKPFLAFLVFIFLLAGCNGLNQTSPDRNNPQQISNRAAQPEKVPLTSRGRVLPDERGENELDLKGKKKPIESIGFLEPIVPETAVSDVNEAARDLTYVAFFSYQVKPNGDLIPLKDEAPLAATRRNGAIPMLVLTNFADGNFQPDLAHRIFTDRQASRRLIQNVVTVMKQRGYRALNVDFEHIYEKDRKLYNGFLETILPRVKREGFTVSTALAPKSSDTQSGPWHGAHDYAFHGKVADFVILMTYEWGWTGGPPMAVAPIPQVRKVVDYAVKKIPREKIVMGAPLYGYDWILPYRKGGPPAKRIAPQEAETFAKNRALKIEYNNRDDAPFFYYWDKQGKKHVVWFENEHSMQAKFNLIKEYGLRGISYWVLGEDFPKNWSLLRENFQIRKY
ncbi:glycosyl hydrolase family 18 protein [Thermoactinomyces mirandus]|uniref:Spore gernimation protein n=1 Tax=Thermoactinomyces mirandus TaxID=2756294 RepID=A0A7W1XRN7_9BACL|nr:glycosyl hydrolase family 18 protein [Thermoactinomyces mirandus]MBA4601951.1 spore gernimation protein [Thermoactinomyces mirandus]